VRARGLALGITTFLLVLAGCESSPTAFEREVDRLLAAPDTLHLEGADLVLEADLWRDFLTEDPPLTASIAVTDALSRSLPDSVAVTYLWLIRGYTTWEVPSELATRVVQSTDRLELLFIGGPHWIPGTLVHVVAEIADGIGGFHLVRISDREVRGTL